MIPVQIRGRIMYETKTVWEYRAELGTNAKKILLHGITDGICHLVFKINVLQVVNVPNSV